MYILVCLFVRFDLGFRHYNRLNVFRLNLELHFVISREKNTRKPNVSLLSVRAMDKLTRMAGSQNAQLGAEVSFLSVRATVKHHFQQKKIARISKIR